MINSMKKYKITIKVEEIKETPLLDKLWEHKNKTVFGPLMDKWEWDYICKFLI
jgi:hypothetical protein